MIYYIDENGDRHNALPKIWNGVTPFPEWYALGHGWQRYEEEDPVPPEPDYSERNEAEHSIVAIIVALAEKYDALDELMGMQDISIPSLVGLADRHGVSEGELQSTETKILILARHLEAITGQTWADTWNGLKTRFPLYLSYYVNDGGDSSEEESSSEPVNSEQQGA